MFVDIGIVHKKRCVETSQHNGRVEKESIVTSWRLVNPFEAPVPSKYWDCYIMTTCYLIKLLPYAILDDKAPYELLYETPPHYSHLSVFGCLLYATKLQETGPLIHSNYFCGLLSHTKGLQVIVSILFNFFYE